jgi:hypothetical protein
MRNSWQEEEEFWTLPTSPLSNDDMRETVFEQKENTPNGYSTVVVGGIRCEGCSLPIRETQTGRSRPRNVCAMIAFLRNRAE